MKRFINLTLIILICSCTPPEVEWQKIPIIDKFGDDTGRYNLEVEGTDLAPSLNVVSIKYSYDESSNFSQHQFILHIYPGDLYENMLYVKTPSNEEIVFLIQHGSIVQYDSTKTAPTELLVKLLEYYPYLKMNVDGKYFTITSKGFSENANETLSNKDKYDELLARNLAEKDVAKQKAELNGMEIIGEWYDSSPYIEGKIIILKSDNRYLLRRDFKDGSNTEKELAFSMKNGNSKFSYESSSGSYMVIKKNGELGLYDNQGFISTAHKLNN